MNFYRGTHAKLLMVLSRSLEQRNEEELRGEYMHQPPKISTVASSIASSPFCRLLRGAKELETRDPALDRLVEGEFRPWHAQRSWIERYIANSMEKL